MKKIVVLMMMTGLLFAVEWVRDFDTAMQSAAKTDKTVMVMVVSQTCRWCKKMKHRTLEDERVESRLKQFISVQVMRDDATVMKQFPKVHGVPTIFFVRPDGSVVQEVVGYFNVGDFLSYIADVEKITATPQ